MPMYDDSPEKDPYLLLHHRVDSPDKVPPVRHLVILTFDTVRTNSGYPEDPGSNDPVCYYHVFRMDERHLWEICIKNMALPSDKSFSYTKTKFVFFECPGKGTLDVQVNIQIDSKER